MFLFYVIKTRKEKEIENKEANTKKDCFNVDNSSSGMISCGQ